MAQLDNVWRQQRLSLSTKLKIYTSSVQSVVLYGSETWTIRKVDSDRIQSFHMQALRRILGIRWYDQWRREGGDRGGHMPPGAEGRGAPSGRRGEFFFEKKTSAA